MTLFFNLALLTVYSYLNPLSLLKMTSVELDFFWAPSSPATSYKSNLYLDLEREDPEDELLWQAMGLVLPPPLCPLRALPSYTVNLGEKTEFSRWWDFRQKHCNQPP